jgi:hypothetical protein
MTLPYVTRPAYLSPSALRELEKDPVGFYLSRCGPEEFRPLKQEQTINMVVGICFDALVKTNLARDVKCLCPSMDQLLAGVENKALLDQGMKKGQELFAAYLLSGAFQLLVEEGLAEVNLAPGKKTVPSTERLLMGRAMGGVPLLGYPDALIRRPDGSAVILDWKCTSAASPHPGWLRYLDVREPFSRHRPPHERNGEHMDTLNPDWAMQLATYSWLTRPGVGHGETFKDVDVAIDQVVYGAASVRVAQFRTKVTGEFQLQLAQRYRAAWDALCEGTLVKTDLEPRELRLLHQPAAY